MSTQSPNPPTSKGSRNNRRAPKNNTTTTTPSTQKTTMLSTPPSSPPRNMSPGGVATDSSNNVHSKKKPPRSGKKPNQVNYASPAPNGHRHTSSQPSNTAPQVNGSAAYAGPTFHASPAPSALPIPSFFSKSFPESDLAPTLETDSDNADMDADMETTPSKPRARPQPMGDEPRGTPLDFLFKAAVQAKAKNTNSNSLDSPEPTTRPRSPYTDSKILPSKPDSAQSGVFPFEMETSNYARSSQIGPSFAPSYQDRMNALRPSSSPSQSPDMTEEQRRIKTAELKQLLLNPRPQKPPASVSPPCGQAENYGPRPNINSTVPHYATPTRTASGPPVTFSQGYPIQQQPMPNSAGRPSVPYPYVNGPQQYRSNTHSPLRREVPTTHPHHSVGSSPSPYRGRYGANMPDQQPDFVSPQSQDNSAAFSMPTDSPSNSDTKKMEDDLRRILKLDAGPPPRIPSSGMQRSFAA